MKVLNRFFLWMIPVFVCIATLSATLFLSQIQRQKQQQEFIDLLAGADENMQSVAIAVRQSPFWVVADKKDVIWGNLHICDTDIKLFRPCRIFMNGKKFVVSLELWTALYHLERECDGNETN